MPSPAAGYTPVSPRALIAELTDTLPKASVPPKEGLRTARFHRPAQITPAAMGFFDILYLPLGKPHPAALPADRRGVLLPPVIFDREADLVAEALTAALHDGVRHLLVGNIGHLPLVRRAAEACGISSEALFLHGDFRLNVANTPAAARLLSLGLCDLILSPELTLPRMRDLSAALAGDGTPAPTAAIVYGRLPLMLLEKCAIREVYRHLPPDRVCLEICARDAAVMKDRLGKEFPILREDAPAGRGHRNVVYNSLPLCMSDRREEVVRTGLGSHHFIFSVESPLEVDRAVAAHRDGRPLSGEVRRMLK